MSELVIAGRDVPRARSPGLWVLAWRRFGRDRVGVVSLAVVVFFCALMTASGLNLIAADWAQEAGVNYAPPTFMGPDAVEAEAVTPPVAQPAGGDRAESSDIVDPLADVLAEIRRDPAAVAPPAPKAATLPFGGDKWGRDVLKKVIKGTQTSMFVGIAAALLATLLGTVFGALAGYYGRAVDDFFNWFYSIFTSVPYLLLILAIAAVLNQKGTLTVVLILGLTGWPKTSGSRGMHVYVRIERRWTFPEVRRAALALAREVERRAPSIATSKWWKEERHGVFLDYNQNAKDRTIAAAYSVRPRPDARVSAPLAWNEIDACEPGDFTLATMPARVAAIGDPHSAMDLHAGSLDGLLELSARQQAEGLGDAPWPPHYRKQPGEGPRVAPSRRRTSKHPLVEIGRARKKADVLAGLERWKNRHPEAVAHLEPADILVDAMRGRFQTWTRIRVNLQHVPTELRPPQEPLDPDENIDDWSRMNPEDWQRGGQRRRPRKLEDA